MSKPKILIISMGGTITGKMLAKGSIASGQYGAEEFLRVAPELRQVAEMHTLELINLDSVDMLPENWLQLADTIQTNISKFDGIVVTHGLDTLQYTATAIAFMMQDLPIPVVFTGAQLPIHFVASDARQNIVAAVQVAAQCDLGEVCVVSDNLIHRAVRCRRLKAIETDAFSSLGINPLGTVRHQIEMRGHQQKRNTGRHKYVFNPSLDTKVAAITLTPGFDPELINVYLERNYRALLLIGFGLGYVPTHNRFSLIKAIQVATERGVPVIVASQANFGHYEMEFYEVGSQLKQAGAISARDMLWETAFVKLMWILGQTQDYAGIVKLFQKNYVMEMVV